MPASDKQSTMCLAIVSHVVPPAWTGQAVMLYRILSGLDERAYCLVSSREPETGANGDSTSATASLPGKPLRLCPERILHRRWFGPLARLADAVNLVWQTWQRAQSIAAAVRRHHCSAVVACTGDIIDPPAGYLASRQTGVPFCLYAFDDSVNQWTARLHRYFARFWARRMLHPATKVIVPNEFLAESYRQRYRANPTVVHNPFGLAKDIAGTISRWPNTDGCIRIVYTGAVYHAHYDAFRSLLSALELLRERDVTLHVYTAIPVWQLEYNGIKGRMIVHPHVDHQESLAVQRAADILFLPLAFQSRIPEVIRTSAPGKLGEYLASGRPVLAHVPGDSFVAWYLKEHGCGAVVDRLDPAMVVREILRIADDREWMLSLTRNACERALQDFTVESARKTFLSLFAGK